MPGLGSENWVGRKPGFREDLEAAIGFPRILYTGNLVVR